MDLLALLSVGLFVGMGHALEADHLAAVSTMLNNESSRRAAIMRGMFWGLGHTLALFLICSAVVLLGLSISTQMESALELAVGLMIVTLGVHLLWSMKKSGAHVHRHQHGDAHHIHVHHHIGEQGQDHEDHHKLSNAARRTNTKALVIGLMHGAAGSAGLLALIIASVQGIGGALLYFAVFGLGSIAGMALISAVASYPLSLLQKGSRWVRLATGGAIGAGAIYIGGSLAMTAFLSLPNTGF
ncbi:MAG: high frequency lysogenization protein HflD [Robiginitomaculum sp.]|nr:MAG: high frequency lysogenization protein HflD [Robiginitomaculum sp.]